MIYAFMFQNEYYIIPGSTRVLFLSATLNSPSNRSPGSFLSMVMHSTPGKNADILVEAVFSSKWAPFLRTLMTFPSSSKSSVKQYNFS